VLESLLDLVQLCALLKSIQVRENAHHLINVVHKCE
jgi:hypothetical protein